MVTVLTLTISRGMSLPPAINRAHKAVDEKQYFLTQKVNIFKNKFKYILISANRIANHIFYNPTILISLKFS